MTSLQSKNVLNVSILPIISKNMRARALVLSADHVFGPYDIICHVRAKNRLDLERVLLNIQTSSPDIEQTMTCIVKEAH